MIDFYKEKHGKAQFESYWEQLNTTKTSIDS